MYYLPLMKGLAIILLGALIPVLSAAAQASAPFISLSQSIEAALAQGYDNRILQGNLAIGRAQHAVNESKNGFALGGSAGLGYIYPSGDSAVLAAKGSGLISASGSVQGAQVGLGLNGPLTSASVSVAPWTPPIGSAGDTTSGVGVAVSQTLWNGYPGGPPQAVVDKSLLALRGKELSAESGRLALIYKVKQAYFSMFAAQQNLSAKKNIFEKQNALLDQIAAVYAFKQASAVDLKTAQINARAAWIDVQSSEHDLRLARIRLGIFMGRQDDADFSVAQPDPQYVPASTLEDAVSTALGRRMDVRQAELNRKSNAIDISLSRGLSTPTVSVTGGVSWIFDWDKNYASAAAAGAGLKVAMPILDARAAQNLIDAGLKQDEVYVLQGQQLRKGIAADIQDAWESVQLQNERVELAEMTAENNDLLLEVYTIQFHNGTASAQDLLTASVSAAAAHTALVQAQNNAQLAVLQLLSTMGY